jgi:hypothetical protein
MGREDGKMLDMRLSVSRESSFIVISCGVFLSAVGMSNTLGSRRFIGEDKSIVSSSQFRPVEVLSSIVSAVDSSLRTSCRNEG